MPKVAKGGDPGLPYSPESVLASMYKPGLAANPMMAPANKQAHPVVSMSSRSLSLDFCHINLAIIWKPPCLPSG